MKKLAAGLGGILAAFGLAASASAHQHLLEPPSRSEDDFLMDSPCGGVERGDDPTVYEAGSTVDVSWVLTQNHFNQFRIAFSAGNDAGFDDNVIGTLPDVNGQFDYTQAVPMPACTCEDCTLQLVQFTATGNLGYYSCADIELVAASGERLPECAVSEPGGSSSAGGGDDDSGSSGAAASSSSGESTSMSTGPSMEATTGDGSDGTSGSPQDTSGESSANAPQDAKNDGGCGCRTRGGWHRDPGWLWMLGGLSLGWRRRRHPA